MRCEAVAVSWSPSLRVSTSGTRRVDGVVVVPGKHVRGRLVSATWGGGLGVPDPSTPALPHPWPGWLPSRSAIASLPVSQRPHPPTQQQPGRFAALLLRCISSPTTSQACAWLHGFAARKGQGAIVDRRDLAGNLAAMPSSFAFNIPVRSTTSRRAGTGGRTSSPNLL